MRHFPLAGLAFVCLATACGGGDDPIPGNPDAPIVDEGWTELIARDWDIDPSETYRCRRMLVEQDMYITALRAEAPSGTHHTVLTVADGGELGDYDCGVSSVDPAMLYASGIGSDDLFLPDGVAMPIRAGQTINLNLHLFNTTEAVLHGRSGIWVKTIPAAQAQTLAEMVFAGSFFLNIPSTNLPHEESGGCVVDDNFQIFALWPHMHQLGRHMLVELIRGTDTTVLFDDNFSFLDQKYYPQATPIDVQAGDRIRVTCTYVNDTGATVTWGDSSNTEMCFAGMFRYPATGGALYECTEVPGAYKRRA